MGELFSTDPRAVRSIAAVFLKTSIRAAVTGAVLGAPLSVPSVHAEESLAAQALPTGGHANNSFIPAWDENKDGSVSRAEYDTLRKQRFASTDANADDAVSLQEYENEYAARLDRDIAAERDGSIRQTHTRFQSLDRNEDGAIARDEYDASGDRIFASLDHDKDGRILENEKGPVMSASEQERTARRSPRSVIAMPTTHDRRGLVEIYDHDGDGIVTRAQYDAQRAKMFSDTDLDRNGKVDAQEYEREFVHRLDQQIKSTRESQLKQAGVRFKSIDGDKDGAITRKEYELMSARMFERVDTNRDGSVSPGDPPPKEERRERREAPSGS